ncbi:MAG: fumarylacetoacetate hydrolase family protein [Candidatus Kariarchaeaceae archaeon]|jgi:2-keto-4-pentenoate hydratase/2-oxohepta-3-ene-1,7-dioic acid hydratase in catechol pathway
MKIATIRVEGKEIAAVIFPNGALATSVIQNEFDLSFSLAENLFQIIEQNQMPELNSWLKNLNQEEFEKILDLIIPSSEVLYAPPYRNPSKIWGIGLNYMDHASDLGASPPSEYPVGFFKPDTTIIGSKQTINIPKISERTTGEAELGIIIGKECRDVDQENWLEYVAGFTTIIDVTAEDILRKNDRYLGLSKCFDTFFSFGPHIMTPDELDNILETKVTTVINGQMVGQNTISNMRFSLDYLVSFYSQVMTLKPSDIISTGTPRAGVLSHGDIIECHIDGFVPLINSVRDLKVLT